MASSPVRMVSGFTMSGGGGLGISGPTPAWAGYLGKSQDKDKSVPAETCPWCEAKGLTVTLRSYLINHEESIRLCPTPTCIFPLVSRPLDAVLASLSSTPASTTPDQLHSGLTTSAPESPPFLPPSAKRPRTEEPIQACPVDTDGTIHPDPSSPAEDAISEPNATTEDEGASSTRGEDSDREMVCASPEEENAEPEEMEAALEPHPPVSTTQEEHSETLCSEEPAAEVAAEPAEPSALPAEECAGAGGSGSPQSGSNWSWLNSLLLALAQCRTLRLLSLGRQERRSRGRKRKTPNQDASPVLDLCARYEAASEHQMDREGNSLRDAEKRLTDLRSSTLQLLQHPLQLKRERMRRPVEVPSLALPVLLELDIQAKELFQHTVQWESQCLTCDCSSSSSCTNTASPYAYLVSDWHPLSAPVQITCSRCQSINEKKILQERVPPVFAVHFADGFPQDDVTACSFSYAEARYAAAVVIQHKASEDIFISWSRQTDGSWIAYEEFTDLRGISHSKLDVPTKEIHMVFWEVEPEDTRQTPIQKALVVLPPQAETTSVDIPPPTETTSVDIPLLTDCQTEEEAVEEMVSSHDQSLSTPHEDTFVSALKPSDLGDISQMDTSIGSATLLDTFEGLSHNDIVTLTLAPEKLGHATKGESQKTPLEPPAVGGTGEPSVPEEAQVTTVSSPPVVRRSRRLAIKQVERKVRQTSKQNNSTDQEESPESQEEPWTPERPKNTKLKSQPADCLSSQTDNMALDTSTLQNTTLFIPAHQISGESSTAPAPNSEQLLQTAECPTVQNPGMPNLPHNSQTTHMPAAPTSTRKKPSPQTLSKQDLATPPTALDNRMPQSIVPLNLDVDMDMDYIEPDELPDEPEFVLPSVVSSLPQHHPHATVTFLETPSSTLLPPLSTQSSSTTSVSLKSEPSPPKPSKQQSSLSLQSQQKTAKPVTPAIVKLENTKTAETPKVKPKPDLSSVPPVKPHMFQGFKFHQKGAPSEGSAGVLAGLTTRHIPAKPTIPIKPSRPQLPFGGTSHKLPLGKTATARPAAAAAAALSLGPPPAAAALLKVKKDPDQATSLTVPEDIKTAALRLKLLKKLKAKKKQLAELDQMLRHRGMVPQSCSAPPSVAAFAASADTSPLSSSQVTSPGTPSTASSDGADMLDMLVSGGGDALGHLMAASAPVKSQNPPSAPLSLPSTSAPAADFLTIDDFLDDVIFDTSVTEKALENNDFDTLDMFL
ncbi:SUMO-specific isopeptidase USPL1 isoform X3 [Sardina pilchardus]|uniref:SUMO-specific isopeptidase USPL1 isoform X3 n=1 Tax=Sardina pilchardus TaxID=27697 RepID=UPI002E1461D6